MAGVVPARSSGERAPQARGGGAPAAAYAFGANEAQLRRQAKAGLRAAISLVSIQAARIAQTHLALAKARLDELTRTFAQQQLRDERGR